MKKIMTLFMMMTLLLVGCSSKNEEVLSKNWNDIVEQAKGTTVNFYGWGGDPEVNKYIDGYLAPILKKEYDVKINRVGMLPNEYLDIIETELQANKKSSIDVVWINGDNFLIAKDKQLLMSDIPSYLPNYEKNIDKNNKMLQSDFNIPTDGYEVPFGSAYFTLIKDKQASKVTNTSSLLEFVKQHPSRFTYPEPTLDFVGSAFVRNVILDIIGEKEYYSINDKMSDEEIYHKIKPAFDYLNELKPYLWREGKTYPQSSTILDNMYSAKEVDLTMTFSPFHAAKAIENKEFDQSSQSFILGNKTIGNTHYLSIPTNANNKAGALVLINEVLSIDAQLEKYDPLKWGDFPVVSLDKIEDKLKQTKLPSSVLSYDFYINNNVSELDAKVTSTINKLWQAHVLN